MNRDRSKKIKGKGWNGIAIELKETENFDLLNLVEMNPINTRIFWKVLPEGIY